MQGGAFRAARFPCRTRAEKVRRAAEARATANSGDDKENVQKRGRAPRFFASYFFVRLSGYRRPHSVSGPLKAEKIAKAKENAARKTRRRSAGVFAAAKGSQSVLMWRPALRSGTSRFPFYSMPQYSNTPIPLRVGHCLLLCVYKHYMAAYPRREEWKNHLRRTVERKQNRGMVNGKW